MNQYVVDVSVVVKWFVPEIHTEHALTYLDQDADLLAPDLLWPEVGNILRKKVRLRELTDQEARDILEAGEAGSLGNLSFR